MSAVHAHDGDDEAEDTEQASPFDWNRFKKLFLCNSRIWKYFLLYAMVYAATYKCFQPWYLTHHRPVKTTRVVDAIGNDPDVMNMIVGLDAHKPASFAAILADSLAHVCLLSDAKYRNATQKQILASIDSSYKNDATDNHILDVHISIWTFCILLDIIYCVRRNVFTNADATMCVHHICALLTSSILKYKQRGGLFWCWIGLYSEGMACLQMIGSLMRVYYQKKRNDLEWIKHFSDLQFGVHAIGFVYVRVFAFTRILIPFVRKWCADDSNHKLTKIWMTAVAGTMLPVGWYWSFHIVRLVFEKSVELLKYRKK